MSNNETQIIESTLFYIANGYFSLKKIVLYISFCLFRDPRIVCQFLKEVHHFQRYRYLPYLILRINSFQIRHILDKEDVNSCIQVICVVYTVNGLFYKF